MDDFNAQWEAMNRMMPRLVEAGHMVDILRMGVESFSREEQARFNKGYGREEAILCIERVNALLERYPDHFVHEGYGFILFTPYTTFDDLAQNFAVAREIGFHVCAHTLSSTLQLDDGTPTLYAVRRDGLEVPAWPDPGLGYDIMKTRAWRPAQSHWRFREPRVATLFSAIVRAVAYAERETYGAFFEEGDPAYQAAAAFWERFYATLYDTGRSFLILGETLLQAARGLPEASPTEEVGAPSSRVVELFLEADVLLDDPDWREAHGMTPASRPGGALPSDRPAAQALASRLPLLRRVMERVADAPRSPLPGWLLEDLHGEESETDYVVCVTLRRGSRRLGLRLLPADSEERALAERPHVKLAHADDTPPEGEEEVHALKRLTALIDHYLSR